jgi:hypothetical protein
MRTLRLLAATVLLVTGIASTTAAASGPGDRQVRILGVAETGGRFVPDPDLVDGGGVPSRGNYFITEGYLYRQDTLTCRDGTCNGVVYDADGNPSPEFPDRVIGKWTCYGTHSEDAATTTTGPLVLTTQLYDLGATSGAHTIVTNGFELADIGFPSIGPSPGHGPRSTCRRHPDPDPARPQQPEPRDRRTPLLRRDPPCPALRSLTRGGRGALGRNRACAHAL